MMNPEIVALQEKEDRIMAEGFVESVYADLSDIKHSFFRIGFRLAEASKNCYYKPLGYQNIAELAEDKFGFKKSTTYQLIQIYELAHNEQAPFQIAEKYEPFSKSQLEELCRLKYLSANFTEIVRPSDTVADIREAVNIWNKHYFECYQKVHNIAELLEKYREPKQTAQGERLQGQLPGQTVIDISEVKNVEDFNEVNKFSGYSENSANVLDEPEMLSEAFAPAMTDGELIDYCLKEGYGCGKHGKFEIYEFYYYRQPTRNLFLDFIKRQYGTGGHGGAGLVIANIDYAPSKGVTIERLSGGKLELPWTYITGRITRLIECCNYLSAEEQTAYIQWKAQQDGLIVNEAPAAEPALSVNAVDSENEVVDEKQTRRKLLEKLSTNELAKEICSHIYAKSIGYTDFMPLESSMREWLIKWFNEVVE